MLEGALNQQATVWTKGKPDRYGNVGWSDPTIIDVRWQDKQQLVRTAQGDERMSQAVIYTESHIALGSRVYKGKTGEPDPTTIATYEPMAYEQMVDLDGLTVGWKVFV